MDPLELELQEVASHQIQVLGDKPRTSTKAIQALNHQAALQFLTCIVVIAVILFFLFSLWPQTEFFYPSLFHFRVSST